MLREFRVGYAPSAWDTRAASPSRRAGFTDARALRRRARRSARSERRAASTTASAGGSCSRSATRAGACSASAARALRRRPAAEVPQLARERASSTRAASCSAPTSRARAPRRRAASIVCRGLHRRHRAAPGRPAQRVGLMGTALTDEQVGELARLAPTVLLALDADSAGQEAMLRAARGARRGAALELRVVPLPAGQDPADLVSARGRRARCSELVGGVGAVRALPRRARARRRATSTSAEGKRRVIDELRPVFAQTPAERDARGAASASPSVPA